MIPWLVSLPTSQCILDDHKSTADWGAKTSMASSLTPATGDREKWAVTLQNGVLAYPSQHFSSLTVDFIWTLQERVTIIFLDGALLSGYWNWAMDSGFKARSHIINKMNSESVWMWAWKRSWSIMRCCPGNFLRELPRFLHKNAYRKSISSIHST
jgi:hypothetical protein